MNVITRKTVEFIVDKLPFNNISVVDLTWFNQYNEINLQGDIVLLFDVADPIYFEHEKIAWIKSINKPVFFIGHPNTIIPCPVIPFLSWLRFRPQQYAPKQARDTFFVSFNRKPHAHRVDYYQQISKVEKLLDKGFTSFFDLKPQHELANLSLDNDIVKLQSLSQIIDEKQLYSLFEIVTETCPADDQLFFTEKTLKCLATETPFLLIGARFSLTILKKHYGFYDFGLDDSYDTLGGVRNRIKEVIKQADQFFSMPLERVFDNAKRNTYHLYNDFDNIHDRIVMRYIEKYLY